MAPDLVIVSMRLSANYWMIVSVASASATISFGVFSSVIRDGKAGGGIIGDNDGRRVDIEDRDSRGTQTADDTEDKAHQAKALPEPFAA